MLPTVMEFLLSQHRPHGGRYCHPSRVQFIIPAIPPGVTISFTVGPPTGYYAAIKFAASHPDEVVPYTMWEDFTQAGDKYVTGLVASDWQREFLPYFILFTAENPISAQIQNRSVLNQPFLASQWNVLIHNREDFDEVMKLLETYGNQTSQTLLLQANDLLKQMIKASGGRR